MSAMHLTERGRTVPFCPPQASGEVWAFGSNECGQLGIGHEAGLFKHVEPRLVKGLQGAHRVPLPCPQSEGLQAAYRMPLSCVPQEISWQENPSGQLIFVWQV